MAACAGAGPVLGMVVFQILFAGLNIFYKLAVSDGMDLRVLIAYRYLFASAFLAPLAYFLERKNRTKLTWRVLMLSFACGLSGHACMQGHGGAELVHRRHEVHLGHFRLRDNEPAPSVDLRHRPRLPLRETRHPRLLQPGQGHGDLAGHRRGHAAHLLQGRGHHPLAQPPEPGCHARPAPRPPGWRARRRNGHHQLRHGVAAVRQQLLLLRALDRRAGEAEQRVPVPLLEHRPDVHHDLAAVRRVRALLRQGRLAMATQVQHQAALLRILGHFRVGRRAGDHGVVREAARGTVRVRVQPADAADGGRAELAAAGREAAPRHGVERGAHRHGTLRRALGQGTRGGGRGGQGQRQRPPRHHQGQGGGRQAARQRPGASRS